MPSLHALSVMRPYWQKIFAGLKTVEGRINDGKAKKIRLHDYIQFNSSDHPSAQLVCQVLAVHYYPTFKEMLINLGVEHCLPGIASLDEGVAIYHSFPGYAEREKISGVVAFSLKHLPDFKLSARL
ncbi:MAG: ASCH domain-containing protein [Chlamydiia bacterium]|nr:ASCH domain-containing protein [Chlamydiia bacterium]MCP5508853.1 ASCH domain-containing protein [Chlamydiales bacterium]HPE84826.1 ASCH domain-containing protein [Chlamydiales bacterium]